MTDPEIRPIVRDCICPSRSTTLHTPSCEAQFRAQFFGAWASERERFYRAPPKAGGDGTYGLYRDGLREAS
jgi:hypothetical protein